MLALNLNPSSRKRTALFLYVSGTTHLYLDGIDQGASTGVWTPPAGVSNFTLFGAGGGGGGGGGQSAAGGGGGGGGAAMSIRDCPIIIVPGSTITVSAGASGAAGAIGGAGGAGLSTTITAANMLFCGVGLGLGGLAVASSPMPRLDIWAGNGGVAGSAGNGGAGGGAAFGNVTGGAGGTGAAGSQGSFQGTDPYLFLGTGGSGGGAANFASGSQITNINGTSIPGTGLPSNAGSATNGGGGNGGSTFFSMAGAMSRGGNGSTSTAPNRGVHGGGGGGGYGSAAGEQGGHGFALFVWDSPW
jgi:hypothetical protein